MGVKFEMFFKLASVVLSLFALIGVGVCLYFDFESSLSGIASVLLFVLVPIYGAYGTWNKNALGIFLSLIMFMFLSIRKVSVDSLLPHIAPISISFPIGDFSNGDGYLVNYFAIFMAIFLAWLLKVVITRKAN